MALINHLVPHAHPPVYRSQMAHISPPSPHLACLPPTTPTGAGDPTVRPPSHSGLLHQLVFVAESSMISVCWVDENLDGLIKSFKFLQQASSNMYAITNLAICVNLALIITVRRRVRRSMSLFVRARRTSFTLGISTAAEHFRRWLTGCALRLEQPEFLLSPSFVYQ